MEDWKEYKYTELASLIGGGTPKTTEASYWNGNIPWLSVKDFCGNSKYVYKTEKHITELGLRNSSTKLLHRGDIIISARGTVGEIAMLPYDMAFNQSCFGIRANVNVINNHYLYYLTKTKVRELQNSSHGSVFDTITKDTFENINCYIPNINEQIKIAAILSSLDDKIELNRRINGNLEQQAQALFKAWFVDFEPFKDGKFVDSELGRIPEGWKVGRLDEIGEIVGGGTPSKSKAEYYCDKGIPWVTPKDLSITHAKFTSKGEVDISDLGYKNSSTQILPKGSVLFSSRAPIGYITIALNDICTNQGFKSVIPKIAGTAFIYCYLKNNIKNIESQATGSTFKEASGSLMKSLKVLRPDDISIYRRFEEVETSLFEKQAALEEENLRLSTLRDTLLPQLMSGELKINDLNR